MAGKKWGGVSRIPWKPSCGSTKKIKNHIERKGKTREKNEVGIRQDRQKAKNKKAQEINPGIDSRQL